MWIYQKKEFNDSMIPDGAIGFIYIMTAIIDGKSVAYIGKKNFFANVKKKMGKDRKSTRLNSSHSQQSRMPSSA